MAQLDLHDGIAALQRRFAWLRFMLVISWLTLFVQLLGESAYLSGNLNLANPDTPEASAYAMFSVGLVILNIATIIIFGMWIYRAAANVVAAGVSGFDYTPGWAVGWYFIPFANLFKPFAAMRQIWNASFGGSGQYLDDGNTLLTAWWAMWLISNIASNISFRMATMANTEPMLKLSVQIGIFAILLSIVLFPVALRIVERITRAQAAHLNIAETFA